MVEAVPDVIVPIPLDLQLHRLPHIGPGIVDQAGFETVSAHAVGQLDMFDALEVWVFRVAAEALQYTSGYAYVGHLSVEIGGSAEAGVMGSVLIQKEAGEGAIGELGMDMDRAEEASAEVPALLCLEVILEQPRTGEFVVVKKEDDAPLRFIDRVVPCGGEAHGPDFQQPYGNG